MSKVASCFSNYSQPSPGIHNTRAVLEQTKTLIRKMKGPPDPSEEVPLVAEAPPSYDFATTLDDYTTAPEFGPSTSTSAGSQPGPSTGSIQKGNSYLFSGPPNAEPLYGNIPTSVDILRRIHAKTSAGRTDTWDSKLNNDRKYTQHLHGKDEEC